MTEMNDFITGADEQTASLQVVGHFNLSIRSHGS